MHSGNTMAAKTMRRILVDHARAKKSAKRGGAVTMTANGVKELLPGLA